MKIIEDLNIDDYIEAVRAINSCGISELENVEYYIIICFNRKLTTDECTERILSYIKNLKLKGDRNGDKHAFATISLVHPKDKGFSSNIKDREQEKYYNIILKNLQKASSYKTRFRINPNSGNRICIIII